MVVFTFIVDFIAKFFIYYKSNKKSPSSSGRGLKVFILATGVRFS
jgi:hypothetical protein